MTLGYTVDAPPAMTAAELELWRGAVESRWGVYFGDGRMYQLRTQIWRRMQAHSLDTFAAYYRLLAGDRAGTEWQILVESVLNHETCFFRHPPSFETLGAVILPELALRNKRGGEGRVAMWSAACSTGAEAYSMALTALQCPAMAPMQVSIEGTDISEQALGKARQGNYCQRAMGEVPAAMLDRYFEPQAESGQERRYQARRALRSMVRFRYANLCDPSSYAASFDVIFCQNVLIYFRQPIRDRTLGLLAEFLNPGGFLVLAPGELPQPRIAGLQALRLDDSTVFRRAQY